MLDHIYSKMIGVKGQDINSKVLKEARKVLGMNQQEFAEMLGSDRTDISRLETGKEIPNWVIKAVTLNRLLKSAGYSLDDLILLLPDPPDKPLDVAKN